MIVGVAGARPNFVKAKPVVDVVDPEETLLVHTGQHAYHHSSNGTGGSATSVRPLGNHASSRSPPAAADRASTPSRPPSKSVCPSAGHGACGTVAPALSTGYDSGRPSAQAMAEDVGDLGDPRRSARDGMSML